MLGSITMVSSEKYFFHKRRSTIVIWKIFILINSSNLGCFCMVFIHSSSCYPRIIETISYILLIFLYIISMRKGSCYKFLCAFVGYTTMIHLFCILLFWLYRITRETVNKGKRNVITIIMKILRRISNKQ